MVINVIDNIIGDVAGDLTNDITGDMAVKGISFYASNQQDASFLPTYVPSSLGLSHWSHCYDRQKNRAP